jgi:hypothetical protein
MPLFVSDEAGLNVQFSFRYPPHFDGAIDIYSGPNLAGIDVPRETSQPNFFLFPALLI